MTAFHTIAIPHNDILSGQLTLEVFAADLWEVFQGRGPAEYLEPDLFFQKTYETEGLRSLLGVVRKRLQGTGGDPVIQIQTPFGGGKTHSLIAMYHRAGQWQANRDVMVGTPLSPRDTLWGTMEEHLRGQRYHFNEMVSPGRDAIRDLLLERQPVLILMDELIEYIVKAAGVLVGETTLAAQTLAYMQELTEAVSTLRGVSLVVTLPSSVPGQSTEREEQLFQQLQRVSGRVEKIYTPVQEHEITHVIRQRLFSDLDENKIKRVVDEFMTYAVRESLLPAGVQPSEYRARFVNSYPFLPEVIDILYHRWGSFVTFQRTRGVLRLLAMVIHSLKDRPLPYISLADFDLSNQEIRRELLKHIGPEFDSVIASDITGKDAGSRKINNELGKAYRGLSIGTRAATTVFMYSFSGGVEKGATQEEIKRTATTLENPSSVAVEAAEQLRSRLFYVHRPADRYLFTSQVNLTRVLLGRMENIGAEQVNQIEHTFLGQRISHESRFKVYIWPSSTNDIPDTTDLKLVILPEPDEQIMLSIFEEKGNTPRVHRNTLFFLTPSSNERPVFDNIARKYSAYQSLSIDRHISLSADQEKDVKNGLKDSEKDLIEAVRRLYRQLYIVGRDDFKIHDLGIPTYGESRLLDEEIYSKLRTDGEILEKIVPLVIKERYLQGRDYVLTEQLYIAGLNTPGESRVMSRSAWELGIVEGVQNGLFGLGEVEGDELICHYYAEPASVALSGNEIIIRAEVCQALRAGMSEYAEETGTESTDTDLSNRSGSQSVMQQPQLVANGVRSRLRLRFTVPKGKVSGLMGVMNLLQSRFNRMEVTVDVEQGQLSDQEYEDKIKEAFRQLGITVYED